MPRHVQDSRDIVHLAIDENKKAQGTMIYWDTVLERPKDMVQSNKSYHISDQGPAADIRLTKHTLVVEYAV